MPRMGIVPWVLVMMQAQNVAAQATGTTATGVTRDLNPAISVNTLFLGAGQSGLPDTTDFESGLRHQETEFVFTASVDPFTSAELIFAYEDGEFGLEEGYVTSNVIPGGIGLRAGQMFVPLGRENTLHAHQLPFVDRSLWSQAVFGGEALSEFGAEVSWLSPLDWFLELRGGVYNGDTNGVFGGPENWDLAGLASLETLWEVTPVATITLQGTWSGGPNSWGTSDDRRWTGLGTLVARYKWARPTQAKPRAVDLLGEFQYADRDTPEGRMVDRGAYGYANVRFLRRWWAQGRYDWHGLSGVESQRGSFALAFVPTEFQALRLQVATVDPSGESTFTEFFLQYNFTIGSHPAHRY